MQQQHYIYWSCDETQLNHHLGFDAKKRVFFLSDLTSFFMRISFVFQHNSSFFSDLVIFEQEMIVSYVVWICKMNLYRECLWDMYDVHPFYARKELTHQCISVTCFYAEIKCNNMPSTNVQKKMISWMRKMNNTPHTPHAIVTRSIQRNRICKCKRVATLTVM